jgi:hypothetical protein
MVREFGVRQVGLFVQMFAIDEHCIYIKNKKYFWNDVISIKRNDDIFASFLRYPSTTIVLKDARIIIIPETLEERSCNKFGFGQDGNYEYNEFIEILENNVNHNNKEFHKYLCSDNYVMGYRWLLAGSSFLLLFIAVAITVFKVNFTPVIYLPIFQVLMMVAGLYMLIRRRINEGVISRKLKPLRRAGT